MSKNRFEYVVEEAKRASERYGLFPLGPDTPVVAMLSGGSDSTALAYVLAALVDDGIINNVKAVHVNHCLRGKASDGDERFVEALCSALGMDLEVFRIDIPALLAGGGNMEAVARDARYSAANDVLARMCSKCGVEYDMGRIVVAHTVDDRMECFYMRSIVGTGPGGFRSMRYESGRVARPLLDLTRQELRDAICDADGLFDIVKDECGNYWREDETNGDTEHFRAYVRHELIPLARKWNSSLETTLSRTMNLIAEEDDMLEEMSDEIIDSECRFKRYGDGTVKSCDISPEFASVKKPLAKRCIYNVLSEFAGDGGRIENRCVEAVLAAFAGGAPVSGYKNNIKGNLAVSANRKGVKIERMSEYIARTSKHKGQQLV